jgi:hypothetical protein
MLTYTTACLGGSEEVSKAFASIEGRSSTNAGSEVSATIGMSATRVCLEAVESST